MAKSSATFVIKTPHSSIEVKDVNKLSDLFQEEIESRAIKVVVSQLSENAKVQMNRAFTIAATFFQRLCARTPLDEDYLIGVTDEGKEIWHRAKQPQCRMDWYMEYNGKELSASDIAGEFPDIFDEYNNSESISLIKDMMTEKFGQDFNNKMNIIFGNNNPYFAKLEYGGYKLDSEEYKEGVDKHLLHGVKNKHSVQAPIGMLRITQMELESMSKSFAVTNLAKRYRGQRTTKEISEAKLKVLLKKFKASKRLSLSDIKEYIK